MDPALRLAVVLGIVLLVGVVAALHRARRTGWLPRTARLDTEALPARSSAPLHLIVFTSPLCGDCHEAPRVALEAAPEVPYLALDVRDHPRLVRSLGVHTTPTFLLADREGRIRWAHVGLPRSDELWLYVREAWDSTPAVRTLVAERHAAHRPQR